MALVGCTSDLGYFGGRFEDYTEQKMQRAASRARNQYFKRVDYKEKTNKEQLRRSASVTLPAAPVGNDYTNPHGIKRAAARTCLAKGMVETHLDMPTISMGRTGKWVPWVRKPSVAPLLGRTSRETLIDDVESEAEVLVEGVKVKPIDDDVATTCPNSPDLELLPSPEDLDKEDSSEPIMLPAPSLDEGETSELENRNADSLEMEVGTEKEESRNQISVTNTSNMAHDCTMEINETGRASSSKAEVSRERVMQRIIEAQRIQVREAEAEVASAIARADEAERRVRNAEQSQKKAKAAELREAAQIEKRMSAELRRKRNQEAHQRALLDKAERTLKQAKQAKESAEADAAAEQARILAATQAAAEMEAKKKVRDVVAMAEEQAKAIIDERLEAVAHAEAEIRAKAEEEALQARRVAEEMAQAERSQAEAEARAVREKAEIDARTMKQRVVNALRAKAEHEALAREAAQVEARMKAEADAQERACAEANEAAKAKQQAESLARREAAESLKRAKEEEQQRSKAFRRQAEQQRRQEFERQKMIEAAREEGRAMSAKEIAEARSAQEEAEAKMRELQARAQERCREMQKSAAERAQLEEEARARLAAAEAQASAIRARAEEEARLLREQALRANASAHERLDIKVSEENADEASELLETSSDETNDWQVLPDIYAADLTDGNGWDIVA